MEEKISGVVERITYQNPENGWTVLRVQIPGHHQLVTVTVHQTQVFPGATLDFYGDWHTHPKYGQQFKASRVLERKPATINALEKYIGSGLIYGVGPAIARRIVKHFGKETLDIFEGEINRLTEVSGISDKKLEKIKETWEEHRAIRDVMMFLQEYGISTLFAVRIYKQYGDRSIMVVKNNPYQLARDIFGIGFHSADRIAMNLGFRPDSPQRIQAAITHSLAASREQGHCFLLKDQIYAAVEELLGNPFPQVIDHLLEILEQEGEIKTRNAEEEATCYYNKGLFYDEQSVAQCVAEKINQKIAWQPELNERLLVQYNKSQKFPLSGEQGRSVVNILRHPLSILTGGPGCGKTTATKALVYILRNLHKKIILAAPTGRAAQRMSEVIGMEAKTIHRLLEFLPTTGGFKRNEENPLKADFLIVDECSMLDISLSASLLKAVNKNTQVLFIGDVDQLPSVGAGNVLKDLIDSQKVPCYALTQVFRQAQESKIINYAHQINKGQLPHIPSPMHRPKLWKGETDCLFIDAEEATQDQLKFIQKARYLLDQIKQGQKKGFTVQENKKKGIKTYHSLEIRDEQLQTNMVGEEEVLYESEQSIMIHIPEKFRHVRLQDLQSSHLQTEELKAVMRKVHPWSTLHYGYSASQMILKLYTETIQKYLKGNPEIQVLSPMTKGSLGTFLLNKSLQQAANPPSESKKELKQGERIFRVGDRVIQRRNNYDLEVFNGDIGQIVDLDPVAMTLQIRFGKGKDQRIVNFERAHLVELDLAYAITIHKSQGSEFDVVIIPLASQHYTMLYRNLVYTGLTRAKKMAIFIGTRQALGKAVRNMDNKKRQTLLKELIRFESENPTSSFSIKKRLF